MVSLRFPFLFSQPSRHPSTSPNVSSSRSFSVVACSVAAAAAGAGVAAGVIVTQNSTHPFIRNAFNFFSPNCPSNCSSTIWGSLSLVDDSTPAVESKAGVSFPSILSNSRRLLGIGLRRKSVFGLKTIDVYAFGVYADDGDIKKMMGEKYGKLSPSELEENERFGEDIMECDIPMTVRLQILYSRLSIGSVRSAFEESVGSRLQKFGGAGNKELLQRFTSQFKDEYKIPRGSVIDLSREQGYVLRTTIDGVEVGSIESKLLCRSILDLYIGEDPFDKQAKEDVQLHLASLLQK